MANPNPYRELPSVDRLLANERLSDLGNGGGVLVELVRTALELARIGIADGAPPPAESDLVDDVLRLAETMLRSSLLPVINATGVIIHTNLGRAPLSEEAIKAMAEVSRGYSNLEFDLPAGERGSRSAHLSTVLAQLTGAEAGIAVNNNAAALLLALSALCRDREVIISRGQAVEIGGGFRIPDVMRQSGATLVEVGTTNRTYLRDYESAITEESAAIMRVHASNFRIVGFTETPAVQDLVRVAHEHGLLVLDDLGSGCLLDTRPFGLAYEPTVGESVSAGADLTMFSGDKLLGGPQAGIIVGKRALVEQLQRHPLMRAVRLDKAATAGLHATLLHYLRGEALTRIPVWRMISMPVSDIQRRARRLARAIGPQARVIDGQSMIGGGSLPEESLPTRLVSITGSAGNAGDLAERLRAGNPPVVGRVEHDALLLDLRTVMPDEDRLLTRALRAAMSA
jgi:L-seryl-tRNA(Ser) seleniumtransferase